MGVVLGDMAILDGRTFVAISDGEIILIKGAFDIGQMSCPIFD
jgi:hypothetical protein